MQNNSSAKKKVLIVIADVGGGHRSAANALVEIVNTDYKDTHTVKVIDLFTRVDVAPFNSSDASYSVVSQNYTVEAASNFLFRLFNTRIGHQIFRAYTLSRMLKPTIEVLKQESPDIIVANHPIVCMIISATRKNFPNVSYVSMITDLVTLLRGWADNNYDLVISPTEQAAETLKSWGVESSKISKSLFPIKTNISNYRDREQVHKELDLDPESATVLITGGGVGTASLIKGIDKLAKIDNLQIIIIVGRIKDLRQQLSNRYKLNPRVKVLGFVDNIQDYMHAADMVIGKPGPATILEIELLEKKGIFTRWIGAQELGNLKYLNQNPNFRYLGNNWHRLEDVVTELLGSDYLNFPSRHNFNDSQSIVELIVQ